MKEIVGFAQVPQSERNLDYTKELLKLENSNVVGLLILTLNDAQVQVCEEEVLKAGYTAVGPWFNPQSHHKVTMYYKMVHQPKAKVDGVA